MACIGDWNMKTNRKCIIKADATPKVLFLGNGILQLGHTNNSWEDLLKQISNKKELPKLKNIVTYAMQPEVVCDCEVEEIQRRISENIKEFPIHPYLQELLELPFDAVITTNYTYEIEQVLSDGKWTKYKRKKAFTALNGEYKVNNNTFVCNVVETKSGKMIPVFHIHGESERKHSMILSYYSYASALGRLISHNSKLKNTLFEHQKSGMDYECKSWLEMFIMADVYSVGFGFDTSEFDVWWAIERKSREKAHHGKLTAYMERKEECAQNYLFESMGVDNKIFEVVDGNYEPLYRYAINDIKTMLEGEMANGNT